MPVKLGYKLNHRVLYPGPIERQSVQLTSSVFHDSTVEALKYYGTRGHPEFLETAEFLSVIVSWFKTVNARSTFWSTKTPDPDRQAITTENLTEKTSFLRAFVDWLTEWEKIHPNQGLTRETFQAARHSSECVASLSEFLLLEKQFQFVLPIKFQSDKIEGKFGKIRQMCGGNMFASARQFLEAERTIRMLKLAKVNLSFGEIKDIFSSSKQELEANVEEAAEKISAILCPETNVVDPFPEIPLTDRDALLYVAGCFARSVARSLSCEKCKDLILQPSTFPKTGENLSFLNQVDRGGLTVPSELVFLTCCHAWSLYSAIVQEPDLLKLMHSPLVSSRKVFVSTFLKCLENSEQSRSFFTDQICKKGHSFTRSLTDLAGKCFNIFTKNFISEINSEIHERKKSSATEVKRDNTCLKVKKLQSE